VSVLLGRGDGTLTDPLDFGVVPAAGPIAIVKADADERPDLAVASFDPSGTSNGIALLSNLGETTTATLVSLVRAEARERGVDLEWRVTESKILDFRIDRRDAGSDWTALREIAVDGGGRVVFRDETVLSAGRYQYRLAWRDGASETPWLTVSDRIALSLEGATPNPVARRIAVAFTLVTADPASLALVDLAGRTLRTREVGSLGQGRHVVDLGDATSMPPGIYLLRLDRGARRMTARVAVLR